MQHKDIVNNKTSTSRLWRTDTRPPEKIFRKGFQARSPQSGEYWKNSLRYNYTATSYEAEQQNCICMTTHFWSAGIFPVNKRTDHLSPSIVYFYAIALPMAFKINQSKELYPDQDLIPENSENAVIDLHSFQTEYAVQKIKEQNFHTYDDVLFASGTLYAYETIASSVKPENIIAAVKVICEPRNITGKLDC